MDSGFDDNIKEYMEGSAITLVVILFPTIFISVFLFLFMPDLFQLAKPYLFLIFVFLGQKQIEYNLVLKSIRRSKIRLEANSHN